MGNQREPDRFAPEVHRARAGFAPWYRHVLPPPPVGAAGGVGDE